MAELPCATPAVGITLAGEACLGFGKPALGSCHMDHTRQVSQIPNSSQIPFQWSPVETSESQGSPKQRAPVYPLIMAVEAEHVGVCENKSFGSDAVRIKLEALGRPPIP